jgi:hypothetical protein
MADEFEKQRDRLFRAYHELSRAFATMSVEFREEEFVEPDTPRPSLWRLNVPQRKPSYYEHYSYWARFMRFVTREVPIPSVDRHSNMNHMHLDHLLQSSESVALTKMEKDARERLQRCA